MGRKANKERPVYGVGIMDVVGGAAKINGKRPAVYDAWCNMLKRAYSASHRSARPTYTGCTVNPEWHSFDAFSKWYSANYRDGMHLDKDLLVPGNKEYGPNTCRYIPKALNGLLLDSLKGRRDKPRGLSYDKAKKMYFVQISLNGKGKYLGQVKSPEEGVRVYNAAKLAYCEIELAKYLANGMIDPELASSIREQVRRLYGVETNCAST